jgi:hypothetical protein
MIGWYYLHENGELIYKPRADAACDIRDSNLALTMWPMDPSDRAGAWAILVEGLALGARPSRVSELADTWHCNDIDADRYADHVGVSLKKDGDSWCATGPGFENLQESPAGFGDTKLEAMASLAKALGLRNGKMWRATFADLLNQKVAA